MRRNLHDYRPGHTFVQGIVRVGLEEEILQSDHDRIKVQNRLPVFSENVQANVALEINVGVVDLQVWESIEATGGRGKPIEMDVPPACTSPLEAREDNSH